MFSFKNEVLAINTLKKNMPTPALSPSI